jgi:hypothetical protein
MNYELKQCAKHGLCQHAVVGEFVFCVQCLVEKEVGNVLSARATTLQASATDANQAAD